MADTTIESGATAEAEPIESSLADELATQFEENPPEFDDPEDGGLTDTPASDRQQAPVEQPQPGANGQAAAQAEAAQTAQAAANIAAMFREAGLDLPEGVDDRAIVQHFTQVARELPQLRQFAQLGHQMYTDEWQQYQAWKQQQGQQPPPAGQSNQQQARGVAATHTAAPAKPAWNLPDYDPSWESAVKWETDANGNAVPVPVGPWVPPDVPQKLVNYRRTLRERGEQLVKDPLGAVRQAGLDDHLQQMVTTILDQRFGARDQQASAQSLIQQNAEWLYQYDSAGNVARDSTGKPMLTGPGLVYAQEVIRAQRLTSDPAEQHRIGMMAARVAALSAQHQQVAQPANGNPQQQATAPAQQAAPNRNLRANAATRQPSRGNSLVAAGRRNGTVQNENMSLREQMAANFAAAGIDDSAFQDTE